MKMKQLEALVDVEGVEEDSELVMRFPRPYGVFDATENLISVRSAAFGWTEGEPPLFENVDFCIGSKARIAILGKNGCGEYISVNVGNYIFAHFAFVYIQPRAHILYSIQMI